MIKTLSISLLLAIGLMGSGIMIGSNLQPDVYNLETIKTETITQTEIYWQTETVEKIIETPVYPELREFESREELVNWLSTQTKPALKGDCIDYCYDLMRKAQRSGYYMYIREITPEQYKAWFNTDWQIGNNHAVCTIIDINNINSVFVIDPTSSYKIYPEEGYYESLRVSN